MSVRLIEALATTAAMAEIFADESVLQAMLDFEVALARAEAKAGVIPNSAALAIARAAKSTAFDFPKLTHDTLRGGTPGIAVSKALAEAVRKKDVEAAGFVHWGPTSQDVADTALILLLKRARPVLMRDLARTEKALARLSRHHKKTVMLGRTLLQAAPPITFGLKAAGWLSAVRYGHRKLDSAFRDALVLQFGGASGTLASLSREAGAVAEALAENLGLGLPEAPWHTRRDRLATFVCACGVLTGSLGKIARDVALLMQNEVAEAFEPGGNGRGGSSAMPHKRNPIACSLALASANRVPGLVASFLSAMIQEHERGAGGWQAECPIVSGVVQATALALESVAEIVEGLSVDPERMRANIENTQGRVFAERASMLLAQKIGKDAAHKLVKEATREGAKTGRRLSEVLAETPEAAAHLGERVLRDLETPEQYLGCAEQFRRALMSVGDSPVHRLNGGTTISRRRQKSVKRKRKKER